MANFYASDKLRVSKNYIINGGMDVWQRGTSLAAHTSGDYLADRWYEAHNHAGVITLSQRVQSPTAFPLMPFVNSLGITVTTADASVATTDYGILIQKIEGNRISDLVLTSDFMTLSFWVYATVTGVYSVTFLNGNDLEYYAAEYTVNTTLTWQKVEITVPLDTSAEWALDTSASLHVRFAYMCGTAYQVATGSWASGTAIAGPNQVNAMATIGNVFEIANVQLEAGNRATPFEVRSYAEELALCQRYYQMYDGLGASGTGLGWSGNTTNGQTYFCWLHYMTRMRIDPTCTFSDFSGTGFASTNPPASVYSRTEFVRVGCVCNGASGYGQYMWNLHLDAEL